MKQRALSIQQKSPVQIFGIFAGRMERVRLLPRTLGHVLATQGMLGETFLFDNGGLFEHFRGFRAGRTILDRNDDVTLLAAVACFMRKELTLVNGYFEVTIPAYLSGEFENHFRMTGKRVSY